MRKTMTSDGIDKLVKKLESDKKALMDSLESRGIFIAAVTEDVENLRPQFDFTQTVTKIENIENEILTLKHARNKFNNETVLEGVGLTIDKALVRMSVINRQKSVFERLSTRMPRERVNGFNKKEIEYSYTNYNIDDAKKKYDELTSELMQIKEALNLANSTLTIEVDIQE